MAKKLTPSQVAKELNNIVETFSGKTIGSWVQEAWERAQKTPIGQAAAGVERAARATDPYTILGLPHSASLEEVKKRYRELSNIFHPDKQGGYEGAMKLLNNAYEQIQKELIKRG
ncbi:MAG: J domain-containing protein [Desulfobacterales bacterium]|nr:J domain-containing protein [Desulfobacterales bacterium]